MILLAGQRTDPCLNLVETKLKSSSIKYAWFDDDALTHTDMWWKWNSGTIKGELRNRREITDLANIKAVYTRVFDGLTNNNASLAENHCNLIKSNYFAWLEMTSAAVITRHGAQGSNASKPYQLQLIQKHGFRVPETIVTNDPKIAKQFQSVHKQVIYKSISFERSIVEVLQTNNHRIELVENCPVQFQEFIEGTNIRVHVIGNSAHAVIIESSAPDYRYARKQGHPSPAMSPIELPKQLADACVSLSHSLGLQFSGIDLKRTPGGEYYCFEVNPAPGYSYFQEMSGVDLASLLTEHLITLSQSLN